MPASTRRAATFSTSLLAGSRAAGRTVVFASHEHERAEAIADRVVHLAGGRVVEAPAAVATDTVDRLQFGQREADRSRPGSSAQLADGAGPSDQVTKRPLMLRDAALVAGKDLRIELRSRVGLNQVGPFAIAVLLLFGLALGPDRAVLAPASAGLFWVAVLLSTLLAVQRSYAIESADAARDGLRLSGLDPAGIFLGKAGAVAAQLLVLEAGLTVGVALLYGAASVRSSRARRRLRRRHFRTCCGRHALRGRRLGPAHARDAASAALSPRGRSCASRRHQGVGRGARRHAGPRGGWLDVLAVFAVLYIAIGTVAFGPLLEDG